MNITRTQAAADVKENIQPQRRGGQLNASKQEFNANERRSEGMNANAPSGREAITPFDAGGTGGSTTQDHSRSSPLICVHLRLLFSCLRRCGSAIGCGERLGCVKLPALAVLLYCSDCSVVVL
jgi:hypothetical protein